MAYIMNDVISRHHRRIIPNEGRQDDVHPFRPLRLHPLFLTRYRQLNPLRTATACEVVCFTYIDVRCHCPFPTYEGRTKLLLNAEYG